jgi:chromosome segregation ATPase
MRLNPLAAVLALILVFALTNAAGAVQAGERIYKWVDEKGVTHYGQTIPTEYRDQAASEMTKRGLTVKRIDAVAVITPDQRKAADERAQRDREEQKRQFEQRRRDIALVNTYTSTREIDDARERSLSLPLQALKGLEPRLKKAQERLTVLQGQMENIRHSGKAVSDQLQEEGNEQKLEVDSLRTEKERYEGQIAAIRAKYESDKKRYVELSEATPTR